jgi:hypothetical protein
MMEKKKAKRGVAIFAKACFGHPSPSKQQKLNATANAFGVAKWQVRRTSGAPKALAGALSFCCLLGLGCPKQAFAKIATPRFFFYGQYIH